MSKGSHRRPTRVDESEFDRRWRETFEQRSEPQSPFYVAPCQDLPGRVFVIDHRGHREAEHDRIFSPAVEDATGSP